MTKKKQGARVGARAGKNPEANLETTFTGNRKGGGGAKPKAKAGGIARKPTAKIRYKKSH
jgi:hypothetical protein